MKVSPKILFGLLVALLATQAHAMRWYSPNAGWFSRDPLEDPGAANLYVFGDEDLVDDYGDANPYHFVANDPVGLVDRFGLAAANPSASEECISCKCKSVKVTFNPGGNKFKPGFYDTIMGPRFGGYIIVAWTVDGDSNFCQYYVNEPAGGATFTLPDKSKHTTAGSGGWAPVPQVWYDATGVWVTDKGNYIGKYKLTQSYKCISSDGTQILTPPTTFKASASDTWPKTGSNRWTVWL